MENNEYYSMRRLRSSWTSVVSLMCLSVAVVSSCSKGALHRVTLEPALARLVSSDATVLVDIELAQLRASPFYSRHSSELKVPLLQGMSQEIGFDPMRDLTRALAVWNGKEAIVVGQGSFSEQAIAEHFGKAAPPQVYKKTKIYGRADGALAVLEGGVLVTGKRSAIERTIDLADSGSGGVPSELAEVYAVVPGEAQIRIASRGGLPFADIPMGPDAASALSNLAGYVKTTSLGLTANSGIRLNGDIRCISPQGAKRVDDAMRGGIGMARLSTRADAMDLLRLWDAIHVEAEGDNVRIKVDLPSDLSDQLLNRATELGLRTLRPNG